MSKTCLDLKGVDGRDPRRPTCSKEFIRKGTLAHIKERIRFVCKFLHQRGFTSTFVLRSGTLEDLAGKKVSFNNRGERGET